MQVDASTINTENNQCVYSEAKWQHKKDTYNQEKETHPKHEANINNTYTCIYEKMAWKNGIKTLLLYV